MRRLGLLVLGGALWLLLAAVPVFADGGPHVANINNGTQGISADSCAGCHRAHTAQTDTLTLQEVPDLCLTCHGASGTGATTDVEDGIQYALASAGTRDGSIVLGALRGGGFVNAEIGSGDTYRISYSANHGGVPAVGFLSKVPVGTPAPVTSTHMNLDDPAALVTVWGNGADGSGAGGTSSLNCTSCHNPHGNGQYRILNPLPELADGSALESSMAGDVDVSDAPLPSSNDVRNYTVIQTQGGTGTLTASQVVTVPDYSSTAGDYLHRKVPWNSSSGANDAPNGQPATFNDQINAWCTQCHTRYASTGASATRTDDDIYTHEHSTAGTARGLACTTCHVAHGSNAQMTGTYSSDFPWPGNAAPASGDSRLLKIDNRGTCQACHDPTGTVSATSPPVGPAPSPLVP